LKGSPNPKSGGSECIGSKVYELVQINYLVQMHLAPAPADVFDFVAVVAARPPGLLLNKTVLLGENWMKVEMDLGIDLISEVTVLSVNAVLSNFRNFRLCPA
jgi:hypothetical protein